MFLIAETILSSFCLPRPPLLNFDDLRIQNALDLIFLDEPGQHLLGFYELSRSGAAARCTGAVESFRRLLGVAIELW